MSDTAQNVISNFSTTLVQEKNVSLVRALFFNNIGIY